MLSMFSKIVPINGHKRFRIFLGAIIQNFTRRKDAPTSGFQRLIDDVNSDIEEIFLPVLQKCGVINKNESYIHGLIPNFQGMVTRIVESGNPAEPVFHAATRASGIVDTNYSENKEDYKRAYEDICKGILDWVDAK